MSSLSRRDVLKALGISIGGTVLPLSSWATNELGEKLFFPILVTVYNLTKLLPLSPVVQETVVMCMEVFTGIP